MNVTTEVKVDEVEIVRIERRAIRRQLGAWLRALKEEINRQFDLPKSGRPGPVRQRSAIGEPPARQFGQLASSVRTYLADDLTGVLEISAPYAGILEDLRQRPIRQPAIEGFLALEAAGVLTVSNGQL